MTVDAVVYCNCFETERLTLPVPVGFDVRVDATGCRDIVGAAPETEEAFDRWNETACEHEDGIALHVFVGNIARCEAMRSRALPIIGSSSVFVDRVVRDGVHAGDILERGEMELLRRELEVLRTAPAFAEDEVLREVVRDLIRLCEVGSALGRPICF